MLRPLGVVALPVLLGACASMAPMKAPDVPAVIAVPAGNKAAFVYKGSGLLNYECRA